MANLTVVYGDTTIQVPEGTNLDALKVAMTENFPELKDATVKQEGETVTFTTKAGTKGN